MKFSSRLSLAILHPLSSILALILFLLLSLAVPTPAPAAQAPNEYELKAVMLFNLTRFVEWPAASFATTNSPIIIGILGHNPFGDTLEEAVHGEIVNGRSVIIEQYDNLDQLKPCHILFIGANEKSRVTQILARLKGQPVLSVSEIDGFSKLPGGMVRFYTNDQKKIRVRLNLESAHAEGLNISSKLIRVAELDKLSYLWFHYPLFADLGLTAPSADTPLASFAQ